MSKRTRNNNRNANSTSSGTRDPNYKKDTPEAGKLDKGRSPNARTGTQKSEPQIALKHPVGTDEKPSNSAGEDDPTKYARSPSNDPAWYSVDNALLYDAASFPYSYPIGAGIDLFKGRSGINGFNVAPNGTYTSVPGICSIRVKPTIGHSRNKLDAANVCANAFYTHVRYVNSGRKNYDPADLMIYAFVISDLISYIMWCQRLYGYMFTYSQRNKFISSALVKANQVDPDDLRLNLANFRYWLNAFINKVAAFVVPNDIAIFKRRAFMYQGYYLENAESSIKDQLYQFVPDGFYQFALDQQGKGCLQYLTLEDENANLWLTSDIMAFGEKLLEPIWGDEDFGLISGDILKAYDGNIIGLGSVPTDYYVLPVHDKYVLSQFRNATIVPAIRNRNRYTYKIDGVYYRIGDICQDEHGNIICSEIVERMTGSPDVSRMRVAAACLSKVLTVENPQPEPADTIEATRLSLTAENLEAFEGTGSDPETWTPFDACEIISGDFIAVRCAMAIMDNDQYREIVLDSNFIKKTDLIRIDAFDMIVTAHGFWYSPTVYMAEFDDNDAIAYTRVISNIDNYTLVGASELKKLHECALLSLFYVPGVAKLISTI